MTSYTRTYNPQVRVGNWNEDLCLREDEIKDFLEKKENGALAVDFANRILQVNQREIQLSQATDNSITFGDVISLYSSEVDGVLASDSTNNSITACPSQGMPKTGITRSAFKVVPVPFARKKHSDGSTICYGYEFCLTPIISENGPPLYVTSERVSFTSCAKLSRQQDIYLTDVPDANCIFRFFSFDPQMRMEMEGKPVGVGSTKVIVNHTMTNQNLCCTKANTKRSHFGIEYEVSCSTQLGLHKQELGCNHWSIVTRQ